MQFQRRRFDRGQLDGELRRRGLERSRPAAYKQGVMSEERRARGRAAEVGLVLLIAASTPAMLGVEALVRRWLLPPELAELREVLAPGLTPIAWAMA